MESHALTHPFTGFSHRIRRLHDRHELGPGPIFERASTSTVHELADFGSTSRGRDVGRGQEPRGVQAAN